MSNDLATQVYFLSNKDYRLGQALFNLLPGWAARVVAATLFDPFHKRWNSIADVQDWIDNHLILDSDGEILAVFNNNQILAERVH